MFACHFLSTRVNLAFVNRCCIGKRFIESYHKIVSEVFGNSTAVAGCIANYLVLAGNDLDIGTSIKSIHHHVATFAFREGEAEDCGTTCGSNLCDDIVISQIYLIIIRSSGL